MYKRQDVDRFTSFEGNTGPYILYTIVRIKSILNKYKEAGDSLDGLKIAGAHSAVSYTHLDVYKRQINGRYIKSIWKF